LEYYRIHTPVVGAPVVDLLDDVGFATEVILESDRIRLVTPGEGLKFWQEWWQAHDSEKK
jgi:hypothetical protein